MSSKQQDYTEYTVDLSQLTKERPLGVTGILRCQNSYQQKRSGYDVETFRSGIRNRTVIASPRTCRGLRERTIERQTERDRNYIG